VTLQNRTNPSARAEETTTRRFQRAPAAQQSSPRDTPLRAKLELEERLRRRRERAIAGWLRDLVRDA
jgi:hypothetical protein